MGEIGKNFLWQKFPHIRHIVAINEKLLLHFRTDNCRTVSKTQNKIQTKCMVQKVTIVFRAGETFIAGITRPLG